MNKVHNIDENNINKLNNMNILNKKKRYFWKSKIKLFKNLFSKKINLEENRNIDANKIKTKYNCLNNIFTKFRPKYKYNT
jgi:hypothetical protein